MSKGLRALVLLLAAATTAHAQTASSASRRGSEAPTREGIPPREGPAADSSTPTPGPEGSPPSPLSTPRSPEPLWRQWWDRNRSAFERTLPEAALTEREREWRVKRRTELCPEVAAAMLGLLHDSDATLRGAAALALGHIGWEPAGGVLLALLADGHREVRVDALLSMGLLCHSPAAYELLQLAAGKGNLVSREDPELLQALAAAAAGLSGELPLSPWIREAARDPHGNSVPRATLILALGLSGDRGNVPLLQHLASSSAEPAQVRCAALDALGRCGSGAVLPGVLDLLENRETEPPVRAAAALAVGRIPEDEQCDVVRRLQRALEQESQAAVRPFLLLALGDCGGSAAEMTLVHVLEKASESERTFAALGLGIATRAGTSPTGFETLLRESTANRNPQVRAAILAALGLSGQLPAAEVLTRALHEESDPLLCRTAAQALLLLPRGTAVATFEERLREENDPVVLLAAARGLARSGTAPASALVLALRCRRQAPSTLRVPLVRALGETQDPSVVPFLLDLLGTETHGRPVHVAAVQSLAQIFDPRPRCFVAPLGYHTNPLQELPTVTLLLSLDDGPLLASSG